MSKVIDIFGEMIEFDCMGCDIAHHKLIPPGGYIYDDGFINISADPEIPIKGFVVLGISKHVKGITELTEEERNKITKMLNKTIEVIKTIGISDEVLLVQEEIAGHFHIWIVPTYDWMKQYGKGVKYMKEFIEHAKQNCTKEVLDEIVLTIEKMKQQF